MAKLTISGKNQITMPVEFVRALGLRGGDKLDAELIDGRIVLWPEPQSYTDEFVGSLRGMWGFAADIEGYVAEERASWDQDQGDAKAWAFLIRRTQDSEAAREIRDVLEGRHGGPLREQDLFRAVSHKRAHPALHQLVELGIVEEHPHLDRDGERIKGAGEYRLKERFFASRSVSAG